MVLNYEGGIKGGECIHLLDISSHYQDISYNILTLLNRLFVKFMSISGKLRIRELKRE